MAGLATLVTPFLLELEDHKLVFARVGDNLELFEATLLENERSNF